MCLHLLLSSPVSRFRVGTVEVPLSVLGNLIRVYIKTIGVIFCFVFFSGGRGVDCLFGVFCLFICFLNVRKINRSAPCVAELLTGGGSCQQ